MRPLLILTAAMPALILFLVSPNLRRGRMKGWRARLFAHRGLHDPSKGLVENTLPAFEAACRGGYGIELDIQFTRDMQVVVFHDDNLGRLAGDARNVCDATLAELRLLPLAGVDAARIPTLREVLDAVDGRVPLLIELKTGRKNAALCQALMDHLKGYRGEYIVESFNPLIVRWFRRNAPGVVRGQLVCGRDGYRGAVGAVPALLMSSLLFNALARPDFIAYDVNAPRFFAPRLQRALFRTPLAAWTVRTPPLLRQVQARGEIAIFERIEP